MNLNFEKIWNSSKNSKLKTSIMHCSWAARPIKRLLLNFETAWIVRIIRTKFCFPQNVKLWMRKMQKHVQMNKIGYELDWAFKGSVASKMILNNKPFKTFLNRLYLIKMFRNVYRRGREPWKLFPTVKFSHPSRQQRRHDQQTLRVLQGNVGNNLQTERQYNCREHLSLFRLQ